MSSESDSSDDADVVLLHCLMNKKIKSPKKHILSERTKCGQFKITLQITTNYFRMNRGQFAEVHAMIQETINSNGCNMQKNRSGVRHSRCRLVGT